MARAEPRPGARRELLPVTPAVAGVLLRRLRVERDLAATLFALVLVTTFVFAAIPRLFNAMSDDGLAYAVQSARPFTRNIQFSQADSIAPARADDVMFNIEDTGAKLQGDMTPALQAIIEHRTYVVDAPSHIVIDSPGATPFPFPRYITMRYQNELEPHLQLTAGRMPARTDERTPANADATVEAQVYEIAISNEAARQLGVSVGDRLLLMPYSDDALVRRVPTSLQHPIAIDIVGLFDIPDVSAEYWMGFPEIDRAVEYDDGNFVHIYATGVMAKDAYPQLAASSGLPFRYQWRFFVDGDAFDAGEIGTLATDLRKMESTYGSSSFVSPFELSFRTGLLGIFDRFLKQRRLTESILSLGSIGLLAVALAVVGLLASLIAERRRDSITLVRGRGGAPGQLIGGQLVEGLLIALPAALLGWLLADALLPGRPSDWSRYAAFGLALATTLLLVVTAAPYARRGLGALERGEPAVQRVPARRIVLELLVVVMAVLGAYLLRRRGLTGDSSTTDLSGFDPYLSSVPVLVGVATGIAALRIYPLPVKLFAWLASLRRDLVPALAFRRVARQGGATNLPLLVLLLSVAVAVFSSIMLHTIAEGQTATSWQLVGADYRVDPGASGLIYRPERLVDLPGVDAIALAYANPSVLFSASSPAIGSISFLAVDPKEFAAVNAGNRAEPKFPRDVLDAVAASDSGQPSNPIPAVVGHGVGDRRLAVGDTFSLNLLGTEVSFVTADVRENFPGIAPGVQFVVAPFDSVAASGTRHRLQITTAFIRAPSDARVELMRSIAEIAPAVTVESRAANYAAVHDAPLISGVQNGFRLGLIVTAIYSALAVVVALVLTGRARARDLAYLRTLGLTERQALALTATEQAPQVALALAIGIGLGVGITRLIEPGIDLTAFTGEGVPADLRIDWTNVVLLALGVIGVVTGAVAATAAVARRVSLGQMLRLGDQ